MFEEQKKQIEAQSGYQIHAIDYQGFLAVLDELGNRNPYGICVVGYPQSSSWIGEGAQYQVCYTKYVFACIASVVFSSNNSAKLTHYYNIYSPDLIRDALGIGNWGFFISGQKNTLDTDEYTSIYTERNLIKLSHPDNFNKGHVGILIDTEEKRLFIYFEEYP